MSLKTRHKVGSSASWSCQDALSSDTYTVKRSNEGLAFGERFFYQILLWCKREERSLCLGGLILPHDIANHCRVEDGNITNCLKHLKHWTNMEDVCFKESIPHGAVLVGFPQFALLTFIVAFQNVDIKLYLYNLQYLLQFIF